MVDDLELLSLKLRLLDDAAWQAHEAFSQAELTRIAELSAETGSASDHSLRRYCIRLRGILDRTEQALAKIESARRPKVAA